MAESSIFADDSRFAVYGFSRQESGEEIIIGRPDRGIFLALPPEAVQVLDDLAAGKTVGETRNLYTQRHGDVPDLPDFLKLMVQKSFVRPLGEEDAKEAPAELRKFHFENFSERTARLFFGAPAVGLYALVIAAGIGVAFRDPSIIPGRTALYFKHLHTIKILGVVTFSFLTLFLHEMSHLLAARAVGVKSRLGVGHRLWVVVAETDLTGLWAVPKRNRYLPILAGLLTDLTTAAAILLVVYGESRGWLSLSPLGLEMIRAIFFAYILQITWQFFFFVRTDLYYVLTIYFDCKNLMGDTEIFLKNQIARLFPFVGATDQSHIPSSERSVIRYYSLIWLFGRAMALFLLFTVTLPLTLSYFYKIWDILRTGYKATGLAYLDAMISVLLFLAFFGIGMGLWLKSLVSTTKPRALAKQVSS